MRAINTRKYKALTTALEHMSELCDSDIALPATHSEVPNTVAIQHGLLALSDTYAQYQALLNKLERTILEYEELHHHLRTNILVPVLRNQQCKINVESKKYHLLKEIIELSRAF